MPGFTRELLTFPDHRNQSQKNYGEFKHLGDNFNEKNVVNPHGCNCLCGSSEMQAGYADTDALFCLEGRGKTNDPPEDYQFSILFCHKREIYQLPHSIMTHRKSIWVGDS